MSAMKVIRRNKATITCILIFTLLLVLGFAAYSWLFPNQGMPVYGNRLKGIEKVGLTDEKLKEVSEKVKTNKNVLSVSYDVKGKIINYVIKVGEKTAVKDAKALADVVYKAFDEKVQSYYDFQVFIENDNAEAKGYPIIGYKNTSSDKFSFNKE